MISRVFPDAARLEHSSRHQEQRARVSRFDSKCSQGTPQILASEMLRSWNIRVANPLEDVDGECFVVDQDDELEVLVVLEASVVQIGRPMNGPSLVEDRHLEMGEVAPVFVDVDAGLQIFEIGVLLRVVSEGIVVPISCRQDQRDRKLRPAFLGEEERVHDGWMVEVRVLDEDGTLRTGDETKVELSDRVGAVVGLVDEDGRSAKVTAA